MLNIESFFMTIRTKCPFVIEWTATTTRIWNRKWYARCPSTYECNSINWIQRWWSSQSARARIWRKIRESKSYVDRWKPFLVAKTWAKAQNSSLGLKFASIVSKRCVIVQNKVVCALSDFYSRSLQYSTTPYLFSLLLLVVRSEERSVCSSEIARVRRHWAQLPTVNVKRQRSLCMTASARGAVP